MGEAPWDLSCSHLLGGTSWAKQGTEASCLGLLVSEQTQESLREAWALGSAVASASYTWQCPGSGCGYPAFSKLGFSLVATLEPRDFSRKISALSQADFLLWGKVLLQELGCSGEEAWEGGSLDFPLPPALAARPLPILPHLGWGFFSENTSAPLALLSAFSLPPTVPQKTTPSQQASALSRAVHSLLLSLSLSRVL